MKFQFEYLQPKTEAIQIIECYEKLGYKPCAMTENFSEEKQWSDDSEVITLFLEQCGHGSIVLHLPKVLFEIRIEYKDWMPREHFEKLCKQDKAYRCAECVLVTDIDRFESLAKNSKSMICSNPYVLRIGCYGEDDRWWSYGDLADMSKYKYVKLIKCEKE